MGCNKTAAPLALLAAFAALPLAAQDQSEVLTTVTGEASAPADLSGMARGARVEGIIAARKGDRIQVTDAAGNVTAVVLSEATRIKASGGFLGMSKDTLTKAQLVNGLPVAIETVQWNDQLVASAIALKARDLRTAAMIHGGTNQRFTQNEAATEALRGRVADIDQYNVKGVTNVYFDTGKWNLSGQAQAELCQAASEAGSTDNALLLVIGYTDSVGDQDYNQTLSEKRASRVVNYLQQACGWKPYRMLTPTGMAEADPAADNTTEAGKAQNRRVAVNILVSKAVDGI